MATVESSAVESAFAGRGADSGLCAGDRLTRAEFERRYSAMPKSRKQNLLKGSFICRRPLLTTTPARISISSRCWASIALRRPGCKAATTERYVSTWKTNLSRTPFFASCRSAADSRARRRVRGRCARTDCRDLGQQRQLRSARQASRVPAEWRVRVHGMASLGLGHRLVCVREDRFERLLPTAEGHYRSEVFPGLWLNAAALLRGDVAQVLAVLQQGIASSEHAALVVRLRAVAAAQASG